MENANDILEFGFNYHLWRDNEYLGIATWMNDPNIGKAFIKTVQTGSAILNKVFYADKWKIATQDIEDIIDIVSS
jgi:hypothetical protein